MRNRREQHAKHKHGRCTDELHKLVSTRCSSIRCNGKEKALRVLGLKEQYKKIDVIKYDEVMALVNKGVSYKEIAEGLGVSLTSFKNRCKELGVKSKRGRKRNRH